MVEVSLGVDPLLSSKTLIQDIETVSQQMKLSLQGEKQQHT